MSNVDKMYDELLSIPLVDRPAGCGGWKQANTNLSIVLVDNSIVNNIECWVYRDDIMLVKNGRKYTLPEFISYEFEVINGSIS